MHSIFAGMPSFDLSREKWSPGHTGWRPKHNALNQDTTSPLHPLTIPAASGTEDLRGAAFAYHGAIGDDHRRAGRHRIIELGRKFRIKAQTRSERFRICAAALARHEHPFARTASRRQEAGLSGRTFQHGKDIPAESTAASYLDRSASDRLTIAVSVHGAVGATHYDGNGTARAPLRIPIVIVAPERTQHVRRKILRRQHQAGPRRKMWHRRLAITDDHRTTLRGGAEQELREII